MTQKQNSSSIYVKAIMCSWSTLDYKGHLFYESFQRVNYDMYLYLNSYM